MGAQVFELKNGVLSSRIPESDDNGVRIKRWDFDVRFDLPTKKAIIRAVTSFHSDHDGPFLVRLSPQYEVSKVTDASGHSVPFAEAGGVVSLPRPQQHEFVYTLDYEGVVDQPRYAGAVTKDEAVLTQDYWYPMVARQPAPFRVTVHAPKEWIVVAQGDKVGENDAGAEKAVTFQMDLPVSYLSLCAGAYREVSKTVNGRRYHVWSRTMPEPDMQTQLDMLPAVIEFYDRNLAPYPFKSFGDVITPLYGGGALEAYSFATYGSGWLPANEGHEPSHTWFGGMLDNTYLGSLWDESFADWCDGLYHRRSPIGVTAETETAQMPSPEPSAEYDHGACFNTGAESGPVASSLGYGKGAAVLLQMEQEFPQTLEWAREWLKRRPSARASDWADFEAVCGPSTQWFFDQWIKRTGWPHFSIQNVRYSQGAVRGEVDFDGAPYRLTVDVFVRDKDGEHTRKVVLNPKSLARSQFEIEVPRKPTLVSFDPWERLLIRHDGEREELSQFLAKSERYVAPGYDEWARSWRDLAPSNALKTLPAKLDGLTIIGGVKVSPLIAKALRSEGLEVSGDKLTYRGTTVDLSHGAAACLVDLPDGGRCAVLLGKTRVTPEIGHARLGLWDEYGRMLRARTSPVTSGPLAFRI